MTRNNVPDPKTRPPSPPEMAEKMDDMDCRPGQAKNPVRVPDYLQEMIDLNAQVAGGEDRGDPSERKGAAG